MAKPSRLDREIADFLRKTQRSPRRVAHVGFGTFSSSKVPPPRTGPTHADRRFGGPWRNIGPSSAPSVSKGHLAWLDEGTKEAFEQGGEVYIAPSGYKLDANGYRQGARWESSLAHWKRYYDAIWKPRIGD